MGSLKIEKRPVSHILIYFSMAWIKFRLVISHKKPSQLTWKFNWFFCAKFFEMLELFACSHSNLNTFTWMMFRYYKKKNYVLCPICFYFWLANRMSDLLFNLENGKTSRMDLKTSRIDLNLENELIFEMREDYSRRFPIDSWLFSIHSRTSLNAFSTILNHFQMHSRRF